MYFSAISTTDRGKHIKVMMDRHVMHVLYQPTRRARAPYLCIKAVKFWNWCICNQLVITTAYLLGAQSVTMDTLSRHFYFKIASGK